METATLLPECGRKRRAIPECFSWMIYVEIHRSSIMKPASYKHDCSRKANTCELVSRIWQLSGTTLRVSRNGHFLSFVCVLYVMCHPKPCRVSQFCLFICQVLLVPSSNCLTVWQRQSRWGKETYLTQAWWSETTLFQDVNQIEPVYFCIYI